MTFPFNCDQLDEFCHLYAGPFWVKNAFLVYGFEVLGIPLSGSDGNDIIICTRRMSIGIRLSYAI